MFRANIYTLEPLPEKRRRAVTDGVEMVAAFMGHAVALKELRVRLRQNQIGTVDPERIGFGNLDSLVELHIMAVPLSAGEGERIGLAGLGRGWAFVNSTDESDDLTRITTAHEVAHGFGYLDDRALQEDPDSRNHCKDASCIMCKTARTRIEVPEITTAGKLKSMLPGSRFNAPQPRKVVEQYDFCLPCKEDLRNKGDAHLSRLRLGRIAAKRVIGPAFR